MLIINIRFTTVSSCLVGNQTESFSVGEVDQSTTIDENGRPIIHGSAFKGALRNILRFFVNSGGVKTPLSIAKT